MVINRILVSVKLSLRVMKTLLKTETPETPSTRVYRPVFRYAFPSLRQFSKATVTTSQVFKSFSF
ncbi:hypothetical protein E2C01_015353 [Portunus trituberculatus]|uniref:Uncharacterized protein n=1 Tax=Portunus trituberculatus TaxID=210409 RepID=A0A5B7DL50_PORTR|nr:hypothetical protein [Portunus trituberculatus]